MKKPVSILLVLIGTLLFVILMFNFIGCGKSGTTTTTTTSTTTTTGASFQLTLQATFPASSGNSALYALLYDANLIDVPIEMFQQPDPGASDPLRYSTSESGLTPGDTVNFTISNIANGSYYCIVTTANIVSPQNRNNPHASNNDYLGNYNWPGTAPIGEGQVELTTEAFWLNIESINSNRDLGFIGMHKIIII